MITTGDFDNANSLYYQICNEKPQENGPVVLVLNYFTAKFP